MITVKIIIFFVALIFALVAGDKLKINAGIFAIAFAFIIGVTLAGYSVTNIISLFPTRVFYTLFIATMFYGFANENGTMTVFTKKLVYAFRNAQWAMPLVLFLIAFILSASGANLEAAVLMLSPIGFHLAMEMNFNVMLVPITIWAGGCAGNWVPWGSMTNTFASMYIELLGEETTTAAFNRMFITLVIILVVLVVVMFIIYKGYKSKGYAEVDNTQFSPVHKKTLAVLFTSLAIIVIPALIQLIAPNPVTSWMASNLSIQVVAAIASAVMALMKLADCGSIIKNRVPWNMIIMICGVSMLMGLITPLGITDAVSELLADGAIPVWLVVPALCALWALLSFFVSGMVLMPLLVSFSPALMALGISGATIITAAQAGGIVSSLSPYSAAGAMAISGCPDEQREKVSGRMVVLAVIFSIIVSLLAFTGIYS
ncbi:MAG: hypothetical protein LUD55_08415 [Oscillospiraceae bacterium]|nr:hypothetical protein [Oscillospiraceae bacterium]